MNEFELIEQIFSQLQSKPSFVKDSKAAGIQKAIGDDASVITLPRDSRLVSCIDTLVQGRHFSNDWDEVNDLAFQIGYKAVAVNVSDIAAMGATPHSILLALALPKQLATETWLSAFAQGLFHACKLFGVTLIGGDTTRNDTLVLSVNAQGFINKNTPVVYRSGAQVGDKVYVSGTLGDAAYALKHPKSDVGQELVHRLHMPTPRITLGKALAQIGATAMIDVSDGLYQDLGHICRQSGVDMHLNLEQLPTSKRLSQVGLSERLLCQLTGGDDYELAFTLPAHIEPPSSNSGYHNNTPVTCIGEVIALASHKNTANQGTDAPRPQLFYQQQAVTQTQPFPFTTFPALIGYQHFTG